MPVFHGKRKGEWLELPASAGSTLAEAVESWAELWKVPMHFTKKLLQQKEAMLKGSALLLKLFPEEEPQFAPSWVELAILYEDDYCLVVNKPPGVKVHPTSEEDHDTLAHRLAAYYLAEGIASRIRHIHRLDEDTTGPVLYAKTPYAQAFLDEAMRAKQIQRYYAAIVEGSLSQRRFIIDAPIGKDRHHPNRRRVSRTGESAITHVSLLAQLAKRASLVQLQLETGRTHQIRVHLSHLGHPIVGDALYGGDASAFSRQALHGERLNFPHPAGEGEVQLEAPWPEDLLGLLHQFQS